MPINEGYLGSNSLPITTTNLMLAIKVDSLNIEFSNIGFKQSSMLLSEISFLFFLSSL